MLNYKGYSFICWYMVTKWSSVLNFLLHKYYIASKLGIVPLLCALRILFSSYVSHLTMCTLYFVCAPLTGSTKLMEWLTVSCVIPVAFILLYAHYSSDITVVPGLMCCLIIGKSVAADLSAISTMNASLVPFSIPPNT